VRPKILLTRGKKQFVESKHVYKCFKTKYSDKRKQKREAFIKKTKINKHDILCAALSQHLMQGKKQSSEKRFT
jgi:hypothetical protein